VRRLFPGPPVAIYLPMKAGFFDPAGTSERRGTLVALDDRARLPWRFLARHMAIDGLTRRD
jgi:hypothetical protein